MEPQRRSYEINKRWSSLQFNSRKISVAGKITLLEVAADAHPIAGGLQREVNVLAGFEFENGEAAGTRHGEKVEDAMLAAAMREDLGIGEARVESGVHARDVLANQGLQPSLRLRAI